MFSDLFLVLALGIGALLVPTTRGPLLTRIAVAMLGGLCLWGTLLWLVDVTVGLSGIAGSNVTWVLGITGVLGFVGLVIALFARAAGSSPSDEPSYAWRLPLLLIALVAGTTNIGYFLAISGPPQAYDTLGCWWPAAIEAQFEDGVAQPKARDPFHLHPEYPRGLGHLVALATTSPYYPRVDTRVLRLMSYMFWPLLAFLLVYAGQRTGRPHSGWAAATLTLALPSMAAVSASGLADVPLAAAVALAGFGLHLIKDRGAGWWIAATGAMGAASFKDEGTVVWLVTVVCTLWATLRHHRRSLAAWSSLAFLATFGFGIAWRMRGDSSSMSALQTFTWEPGFLLARLAVFPEVVWEVVSSHWKSYLGVAGDRTDSWFVVVVMLLALTIVIPRGRPRWLLLPALALLAAQWVLMALTPMKLSVQLDSTLNRLAIQVTPLLALGACMRLLPEEKPESTSTGSEASSP